MNAMHPEHLARFLAQSACHFGLDSVLQRTPDRATDHVPQAAPAPVALRSPDCDHFGDEGA